MIQHVVSITDVVIQSHLRYHKVLAASQCCTRMDGGKCENHNAIEYISDAIDELTTVVKNRNLLTGYR